MYTGLLASPMLPLPNPPYICSTGNCTWGAFGTLAVGVQCVDLTESSRIFLDCTHDIKTRHGCHFSASDLENDFTPASLLKTAGPETAVVLDGNIYVHTAS